MHTVTTSCSFMTRFVKVLKIKKKAKESSTHAILYNVYKISFRSKSMLLYNFVIQYFSAFRIVFNIDTLTSDFSARKRSKQSHRIMHVYFTLLYVDIHHIYDCNCRRPKFKGMEKTSLYLHFKSRNRHLSIFITL